MKNLIFYYLLISSLIYKYGIKQKNKFFLQCTQNWLYCLLISLRKSLSNQNHGLNLTDRVCAETYSNYDTDPECSAISFNGGYILNI
jgi:hypothetical protein